MAHEVTPARARRWFLSMACAAAFASALAACGGSRPAESPARKKPLNAASVARSIAGGKVELSVLVDKVRAHPAAPRIAGLGPVAELFEGTDIDVLRDVERLYATGPSLEAEHELVIVARHGLSRERLDAAMSALVDKSTPKGRKLSLSFPAVVVSKRGHARLVAEPEPGYLVVLPPEKQADAARFVGTGGFEPAPEQIGVELRADDPHTTLAAPRAPRAPASLRSLHATLAPRADGGADVVIEGKSASVDQAPADAEAMTREIARATSAKVAFVTVHFFREVPFRAEGDKVRGDVALSADEIDQIVSLSERFAR